MYTKSKPIDWYHWYQFCGFNNNADFHVQAVPSANFRRDVIKFAERRDQCVIKAVVSPENGDEHPTVASSRFSSLHFASIASHASLSTIELG